MGSDVRPHVGVVILGYGDEPWLRQAVTAVLTQVEVDVNLVVVDNGARAAVAALDPHPLMRVITPGENLGFTGGVHAGTDALALLDPPPPLLALVNSDAILAPDALRALAVAVAVPGVAITTACVRLAAQPDLVNTVGNPLHVLGLSWAGGLNDPASAHAVAGPVASASGAAMIIRRAVWDDLGGLCREFFAYVEDAELSWRCWQHGWQVRYEPTAVAFHHYEFSRNPLKQYLLERNRLAFVLTCWGWRMLVLLALPLLAFELAMVLVAWRQGWGRAKLRGWWWLIGHARWVARRRSLVQSTRTVADGDLASLLTARFDPKAVALPPGADVLQGILARWWDVARRAL